jgi:Glyoxalase superfamily protein
MDEEVIPILRVSDAATAAAWYQRLGFGQEWEHRFEPSTAVASNVASEGGMAAGAAGSMAAGSTGHTSHPL